MKYFVYALSKKLRMIIAALSCPDETTGKRAYMMACQHMDWHLEDSVYGLIRVKTHATISVHNGEDQGTNKLNFNVTDFEFAELLTKERICEGKTNEWHDNFMRLVDYAMEELTDDVELLMHPCSTTEEEARDSIRAEFFPKLGYKAEDVLHSIVDHTKEHPAAISQSVLTATQAASGNGHTKSAVDAYNDSIEWADEPANVNINRIALGVLPIPVNVVDQPKPIISAVVAINRLCNRLDEPISVYQVPKPNSVIQEDIDELLDRIDANDTRWVSAQEYADAVGCKVSTLRKYRETENGVVFSLKNPLMGMDKAHNIFRKTGYEQNAPCLYLCRACASHASHAHHGR